MGNEPIKAAAKGHRASPYFCVQNNDGDKRFVIHPHEKSNVRSIVSTFLKRCGQSVEVKLHDFDDPESTIEYVGSCLKSELLKALSQHEMAIFHYGYHTLMIRNKENQEILVFDDHGLIFLYTKADVSGFLNSLNIPYSPNEKLLYEYDHWHINAEGTREGIQSLVTDLNLKCSDLPQ